MMAGVSDTTERDRWHVDDRWYAVTMTSVVSHLNRDGMALELEDVGPSPGRGLVLEAFYDDDTGHMSLTSSTTEPLPIPLVEAFIAEVRRRLPPTER